MINITSELHEKVIAFSIREFLEASEPWVKRFYKLGWISPAFVRDRIYTRLLRGDKVDLDISGSIDGRTVFSKKFKEQDCERRAGL